MSYILTSESVNIGHPDKMCDAISDTILDMLLSRDKNAQVAVECAIKNRDVFLLGEVTTSANIMTIDYENAVRETLKFIGYEDYQEFNIYNHISKQSPEINIAVTRDTDNLGAGDIGMMWGYACNETKEFMPLPIMVAHKLMLTYDDYRRHNPDIYKSDAKAQVSVKYEKNTPIGIPNIILCVSHAKGLNIDKIREDMRINVVEPTLTKFNYIKLNNKDLKIIVNPSGEFSVYGPISDAGLTGRKIAVDTYGSLAKVGGGCVDKETEFLTPNGWKKINEYSNDYVAQWENGKMSFTKGEYVKIPKTKMYHAKSSKSIDMVLSDNHNFLYRTSKGNYHKIPFENVVKKYQETSSGFRGQIPIYFEYDFSDSNGISLTDDEIRLQIAFCADGNLTNENKWAGRINVKKDYKKDRLIELLKKCSYDYLISKNEDDNYMRVWFNPPLLSKSLKECFQNINRKQAEVIYDEVTKWDGNRKDIFRTTIKEDADFVQFIFMAIGGKNAKIITEKDRRGQNFRKDKKYIRKSVFYIVSKGKYKFSEAFRKTEHYGTNLELSEYNDEDKYMYCINVPTHNLILRRNNKVFITGNCFSGKNPTKVDRSGAYYARYVAKNIVAAGLADKCEVQVSYAIGMPKPTSIYINCFGTNSLEMSQIYTWVNGLFDFSVSNIIKELDLLRPIYRNTACYGHFGRECFPFSRKYFPWETIK